MCYLPGHLGLLAASSADVVPTSIFNPAAPSSSAIVSLAALVVAIAALIFCVVEGILIYSMWRFRQTGPAAGEPPQVYGSQPIEVAWTAAPGMIVLFLVLVTTRTLWEVNSRAASDEIREATLVAHKHDPGSPDAADPPPADGTLRVNVVGRQWWWEYRYESYDGRQLGFITANELHIPASEADKPRATRLLLDSADVCHSYWVPRLGGKMDVIPGHPNVLWLESAEPGLYLGQCAEYCGTQHANMLLRVSVDPPAEFERWLEGQLAPAVDDPGAAAGRQAFLSQSCVNCHRIRGTAAVGSYAPDLTHLASRQTLASGMVVNNRQTLDQWIDDPQQIKPGCLMPAFKLSPRDRRLIVDYLSTLR